jgi:hypothetical protein
MNFFDKMQVESNFNRKPSVSGGVTSLVIKLELGNQNARL